MKTPLRVLHVFAKMDRGGAESMIMNIYRNIDKTKIQFDFIVHTKEKGDFDDEIYRLGGKIFTVPRYKGINHFNYSNSWRQFFDSHEEYHIIHGHVRSTATIYLKIAKDYHLITIAHSHSTSNGRGFSALIKNILQLPVRNIANYLFAASDKAAQWMFGDDILLSNRYYLLPNSVNLSEYVFNYEKKLEIRKKNGIPENYIVLGHVGNLKLVKNHDFLLDIFYEVHKSKPESLLILIGEGEMRKKIEEKIAYYNLENSVFLLGKRDDVPDLLQLMDYFVMPSFFEGLPVSLIEAQASGLKCFVSNTVTEESNITGLVNFFSLEKKPKFWAEAILSSEGYERLDTSNLITDAGYNSVENAKTISDFYYKIVNYE